MRRLNFIWYILILVILPISIILLSGNIVMRISATYTYHFNDSQVIEEVGSVVSGSEFADAITDYFNSPGRSEFQVYEENGEYRDPIFDDNESRVMVRSKTILLWTLFTGIVLFGGSIAAYIYMTTCIERERLRILGFITIGVSVVGVALLDFLILNKEFRVSLYNRFIGIELGQESTLRIILGSPFEKTYVIFSSILAIAIIGILVYVHYNTTKEKRLFS